MPTVWDSGYVYDPEIADALAETPVLNGELARSAWATTIDALHVASLAGLPPLHGVSLLASTTARQMRLIRPPFARSARVALIAAGSGDIVVAAASGGSGTVTVTASSETGIESGTLYQSDTELSLDASDVAEPITLSVSRSGTGVQVYALALIWGGWSL